MPDVSLFLVLAALALLLAVAASFPEIRADERIPPSQRDLDDTIADVTAYVRGAA
jgi:hypothetical protein